MVFCQDAKTKFSGRCKAGHQNSSHRFVYESDKPRCLWRVEDKFSENSQNPTPRSRVPLGASRAPLGGLWRPFEALWGSQAAPWAPWALGHIPPYSVCVECNTFVHSAAAVRLQYARMDSGCPRSDPRPASSSCEIAKE